jgi:hypothetical protein
LISNQSFNESNLTVRRTLGQVKPRGWIYVGFKKISASDMLGVSLAILPTGQMH